MKKLTLCAAVFFCLCAPVHAAKVATPAPPGSGTYAELGEDAEFDSITVGGIYSRITFDPNLEYISNEVDEIILFQGAGGATDQSIAFDLDGAAPEIYSPSADSVIIKELFNIVPPVKDIVSIPASGYYALSVNTRLKPTVLTTNNAGAILVNNQVGGAFFDAGSTIKCAAFGNSAVTTAFGGLGDGGSSDLSTVGVTIFGASSLDIGSGLGGTYTTGDILGLSVETAKTGVVVAGDAVAVSLLESGSAVAGSQTMLSIEEPTQGATNFQVVLEGVGAGAGIWLNGTTTGCRVYTEATATNCAAGTVIISGATTDLCGACN